MTKSENRSKGCIKLHRAKIVLLLELLTLIVPLSLLYCLLRFSVLPFTIPYLQDPFYLGIIYRIACVFAIIEVCHRYYNDLYILGNQRIIHFKGRLSMRYRRISISYSDVREIKIRQSIGGRMFDYGDLHIGTASTGDYEIVFRDIPRPSENASFVEEHSTERRGIGPHKLAKEQEASANA